MKKQAVYWVVLAIFCLGMVYWFLSAMGRGINWGMLFGRKPKVYQVEIRVEPIPLEILMQPDSR